MSRKQTEPGDLNPEQVAIVFEEIASTATVVKDLLGILIVEALDDEQDRQAVIAAADLLAGRMGLLADFYGARCGAPHALVKGGADAWLMPRAFQADVRPGQSPGGSIR